MLDSSATASVVPVSSDEALASEVVEEVVVESAAVLVPAVLVEPVSVPELELPEEVELDVDPVDVLLDTIEEEVELEEEVEPEDVEVVSSSPASSSALDSDEPSALLVEPSSSREFVVPKGLGPGSFLHAPVRPTHSSRVPNRRIITSRFIVPARTITIAARIDAPYLHPKS